MSPKHKPSRYNQQFFRDWGGPGPLVVGLIAVLLVLVGLYLAFTKSIPFVNPAYEVKATFSNAVNIALKSPVRIAGINVGTVTGVEAKGRNTVVTFTVDGEGRPVRTDASAQIRPRLFLEGNWFIDLDPGTPEAEELGNGEVIPVSRTSTSVQIGDVLRTLQTPERANIQRLLKSLGEGLNAKPTAMDDLTFEPFVQGLSGGEALNLAYRNGERAARGTAIVNEASLGNRRNDLPNLIRGLTRVTGAINARGDDVEGFVDNFATFTGALAAESQNLELTIQRLGPTLVTARQAFTSLNAALPALRGYAIALTPALNEVPATIRAARPFTDQLKLLLTDRELAGLARTIKRSTPASAKSLAETMKLLPEFRNLGLCIADNLIPTGDQVITADGLGSGQPASREALFAAVGSAGSASLFDGNGPLVRFQTGGGPVKVKMDDAGGGGALFQTNYGRTSAPTVGTAPIDTGEPPIVSDFACHTQDVPDLNGAQAGPGPAIPAVYP